MCRTSHGGVRTSANPSFFKAHVFDKVAEVICSEEKGTSEVIG